MARLLLALRAAATNAALALVVVSFAVGAQGIDNTAPGVLILHSNQRPTPAQVIIDDTLRAVVPQEFKRPVNIFSEYLDVEWASLQTYGLAQAEFLRAKYGPRNISVIVADALPALRFGTEFRDRLFPGVPLVYLSVAVDRVDRTALRSDFVGVLEDFDPTPTLQLALRLHPGASRVVLVRGAGELDRLWDTRIGRALERLEGGLQIEYLSGLSTAEVLRRVGTLPPGTIVFTPGYFVDGAGEISTPRASAERIAQASTVPAYGAYDTQIGTGIIGGHMSRFEDEGKQAGAIIVRLLNGTSPSEIPTIVATRAPMVDWRQIRRWGVDERLLPAGTVVMFREPTTWEKYWREISLAVAIFVIQLGLISSLLIERGLRLRTAAALTESEQQMTLAARAARLTTWVWEVTRNKLRSSARLRHLRAQPGDPPVQYDQVLEAVHPADRAEVDRAVRDALTKDEELDVEYRVMQPDGDVRWVAARGRAEKDGGRLRGVALDITERKAEELQAAQDRAALTHMTRVSMLGQLSASIAHQLNQPLAAILGNAEAARKMLGRENVDLAELREICNDIVSENNRAAEVIRRLGALYKRGETKMEPIDLNALIRETLDLLRAELLVRHVTVVTELSPSLPGIEGGSVQLQQVLLNLVLNAADAMGGIKVGERRLTIRTDVSGDDVRFCLSDNGSGIAVEHLPRIFDAFWSTKTGGMGIGLAICQSIVAAHHGSITAANNPQGGASFCVTLPVKHRT